MRRLSNAQLLLLQGKGRQCSHMVQKTGTQEAMPAELGLIMPAALLPACRLPARLVQVGRGAVEGLNVAMLLKLFLLPVGSGASGACVGLAVLPPQPALKLAPSRGCVMLLGARCGTARELPPMMCFVWCRCAVCRCV